jgi:hypothetical protein
MNPDQLAQFLQIIAASRQPVERADAYAYPRGWNGALDFVERVRRQVMGLPEVVKTEDAA